MSGLKMSNFKMALYAGIGSLSTMGFYRGYQGYVNTKNQQNFQSIDYFTGLIFGFIGASTYANPAFLPFVVHDEFISKTGEKGIITQILVSEK